MAGKNPFKGLYCYEEDDKDIFYGRDNEAAELFSLVALNGLTVVFGKSGIGKTSLLNAGLFPLLRVEEKFLPVRMRLDYSPGGLPLLDQVKQAIQKELKNHDIVAIEKGGSELADSFAEGESLWEYFHRVDHINSKTFHLLRAKSQELRADSKSPLPTVIPVLVFDQFEELFTIGKHHGEREKLIEELYWLIEDQVPPAVKERVLMNRDMVSYLRAQAVVRVVFGLREDYLPHLNALKRRIPSIHRVLFRIIHLNGYQAREVMDKSGAFREEKIKQEILQQFYPADMEPGQTVTDEKLEVEPALLSLLCYQVFEQGVETLSGREKDAILAGFYDQVLGELPRGKELAEWIENHLLTEGGFRTPHYLERAHELRDTVDVAVDKKLLRKLYIGEKEHVEIIHDVLAPVIRERRNQRLEEKMRLEMEREMRLKRVITTIITVAGIIAIALSIFAFIQKNRADELYRESVCNRLASESTLILPKDNVKAIRIAKAAYIISKTSPPPAVVRALAAAAYFKRERSFCNSEFKHKGPIFKAVFSPDSKRMLTASGDCTAKLWDLDGKLLDDIKGHIAGVHSAVFSPDGIKILTASDDKTAKLWDLTGKRLADFKGHTGPVKSAVFSPDGSKILTASGDKTAKLWDLTGKLLADFKGHAGPVNSAVFSPDGRKILTASDDTNAKLWNLNGTSLMNPIKHKKPVKIAIFSPDGRYILTLSYKRSVEIWNLDGSAIKDAIWNKSLSMKPLYFTDERFVLEDLQEKTKIIFGAITYIFSKLYGHMDTVYDIELSSDSSNILTASEDGTAKLWDLHGNLLADLQGHTDSVNSAVFSPDGKRIVTASNDGTAIIWLTPEGIMDWLKTAPIPKLTQKEKEELGIAGFKID